MSDELTDAQCRQWFDRGYNKGKADALFKLGVRDGKLVKCPSCECWTLPADDERWCSQHGAIPPLAGGAA